LNTVTPALDALRDELDLDGALTDLAQRIDAERGEARSIDRATSTLRAGA
jgi:hypothetical protein